MELELFHPQLNGSVSKDQIIYNYPSDLIEIAKTFLGGVHLNADSQVEGDFERSTVVLQILAKGGGRFVVSKSSRFSVPFQIRSEGFFSFFFLDDLVDPQARVDQYFSKGFKLVSDDPANLNLNTEQIAALRSLCELGTVMRVINNPSVDGFKIYFKYNLARSDEELPGAISIIQKNLTQF